MGKPRVLVIGLDGFDVGFVDQLIAAGELPALRALRDRSARFLLDHGAAARTGLVWEHFASGLTPEAGGRAAVVKLEPSTYEVWQEPALFEPFFEQLDVPSVVFDAPYFDLARAPSVRGVVAWGAHDPGVATRANPGAILTDGDIAAYPVPETLYGSPWPSVSATSAMGAGLVRGIAARAEAASWLLGKRFDDWQLALVVSGESHSAAEAFWHGIDPDHPLHDVPSAVAAANCMTEVYRATDRFVADVVDAAGAETVVVFSMGGMGPNRSDVPSMVLLPELLLRWACHESLLEVPAEWSSHPARPAAAARQPGEELGQSLVVRRIDRWDRRHRGAWLQKLPAPVKRGLRRLRPAPSAAPSRMPPGGLRLDWQPATRYRQWWPKMAAFALPSFYDGRIRVNLRGRERDGVVDAADYGRVCDDLELLLRECRDPMTGEPVLDAVERVDGDPFSISGTDADLVVVWRAGSCAFEHPEHGLIGPVPFLRSGGHTGPYGFAYIADRDLPAGDHGVRSAFDVAPTIVEMVDCPTIDGMSGTSLLQDTGAVPAS